MASVNHPSDPEVSEEENSDPDDMGIGLNFESREEIERIEQQADDNYDPNKDGEKAPDAAEEGEGQENAKKRKTRQTYADIWKHFNKGPVQKDGSYLGICKYCGAKYLQGQQRGTSSMRNHINKSCKVLWNLDKKAFCLVLDNASSNDACINELFASTPIIDDLPVEGKLFHQRCGCHILNLIVQDGIAVLKDEIGGIRETMKYIRHSQSRMEKFRLACSQVQVPYRKPAWDVPTRWNSTYVMLQLALELRLAICRYATLDKRFGFCPADFNWDAVQCLVAHLKVFYDATLKLSGTKYPTLNLFFTEFCEVYLTIRKMSSSQYTFIVQMSVSMLDKFDKYWRIGNSLLAIACVLDPRCKLHVVEYYMKQMSPENCDNFIDNLRQCMKELFKEYMEANAYDPSDNQPSMPKRQKTSTGASTSISDTRAGLKDYMKGKKGSEPPKSELDDYLGDAIDETSLDEEFDILSWWRLKSAKYPVLSQMTRDILAVPISTVASESAFSTSGRVLSPVRSSLSDETVEALLCAQDWLRASINELGEKIGDSLWNIEEGAVIEE
ncbi:Zinc finger BED domain-containing protein DAYSLEEPER [Rhynchospora pubera]|uniref:Zinc finger BED domain-containing protein DAYSLEEPER n=1 Tax=Rhynchospora pubera TaxID=906938 RepID=A0AAV8CQE4_9POAL|nr:Zinc finger BED domain-containing protein DAYSLEEPER [Rhynchospora pubera]